MDPLTAVAASGMRARMESLDLLANNLANSSTQGYKADRESFTLYLGEDAQPGGEGNAALSPFADRSWIDFTQGTLQPTGNPFEAGLSGAGFFVAEGPDGLLYTRNGSFEVSGQGVLLGPEGYPIRGNNNLPVRIDPKLPFEISKDGTVLQNSIPAGKLAVVKFNKPDVLAKRGANYLKSTDPNERPVPAAGAEVHQGKIESSNVGAAESAIRLISIMRHFEMLQKVITLGGDMNRKAIEEVARVT